MRALLLLCVCGWAAHLAAADQPKTAPALPAVSAYAPIRILLDGAKTAADCQFPADTLRHELETFHFPPGWTLGIVCNPVRWEELLLKIDPPRTHTAFTKLSIRTTVFNGTIFQDFPASYRLTIAHELAHIHCQCADEARANSIAADLMKQADNERRAAATRKTNAAVVADSAAGAP
jgi:hypothetical protein